MNLITINNEMSVKLEIFSERELHDIRLKYYTLGVITSKNFFGIGKEIEGQGYYYPSLSNKN